MSYHSNRELSLLSSPYKEDLTILILLATDAHWTLSICQALSEITFTQWWILPYNRPMRWEYSPLIWGETEALIKKLSWELKFPPQEFKQGGQAAGRRNMSKQHGGPGHATRRRSLSSSTAGCNDSSGLQKLSNHRNLSSNPANTRRNNQRSLVPVGTWRNDHQRLSSTYPWRSDQQSHRPQLYKLEEKEPPQNTGSTCSN